MEGDGGRPGPMVMDPISRLSKLLARLSEHIDAPISEVPDGVDADAHAYAVRVLGGDAVK